MLIEASHFKEGAIKVKCLSSLSPILWKGGRESIVQRRPAVLDIREAMLLGKYYAVMLC